MTRRQRAVARQSPNATMKRKNPLALLSAAIAFALTPAPAAETAGGCSARSATGRIEGRVFNPSTGE